MAMDGVRLLDQGRPGLVVGYRVATLLVGQMAEVWGRPLGPLRWLGGEMQLNREACCCGSRSVSPTTGTPNRCATACQTIRSSRAHLGGEQ
jgi:hypothetical protein